MSPPSSNPSTDELLRHFRQAFTDSTLSTDEARRLRQELADHGQHGAALDELRHQLFAMARARFNSFQDKSAIEWLESASALLLPAETGPPAHTEVHFSPGTECVEAIQRFISHAAHRLDVCVFTISDDRLTDCLLTAHRHGVQIRLLTDDEKLFDKGSDIRQLAAAGIPVRTDVTENHMHHKFAVADGRVALTGSYNWTRSAALYNLENLLITDEPAVVRRFSSEFDRLWAQMTVYK
ncbi:phospholipase D-like domain-containing protein [Hymenobacter sp. BT175]|uniref:phospholipase D-like domain-containing protein n=1 Tax=Hymenobacter translucens TaxID=2886507 RepID=UPI001D0F04B1|nr:phospholipase D-like domain-containing protein [Hymenobacter translucens]MCC2548871.1 phospholipase D-like domain-containing protein [Hymenobacter translucens]